MLLAVRQLCSPPHRRRTLSAVVRLYAPEIERLGGNIAQRLAIHLASRDEMYSEALQAASAVLVSQDWSLTDQTSHVAFPGIPGGGSLGPRLRYLADRYPLHFGE